MTSGLISLIRFYRACISPYIGRHCRFYPSCSHYAIEALTTHGCRKGLQLSVWRLARCHPFSRGGHDPVPPGSARTGGEARPRTSTGKA